MNLIDAVKPFFRKVGLGIVKNAPHLLMGAGTGASITAVIFATEAAPKAKESIMDARIAKTADEKGLDIQEAGYLTERGKADLSRLTLWEWVQAVWKYYGPAAAMELLALICFWCAHGIDIRRQAVLAGLATTAEEALKEYQRKVKDILGQSADQDVRSATAQEFVDRNPPPPNVYIESDTERDMVFVGQYFRSSYYSVKNVENEANHEMIQHMYISQQELMWLLDPEKKYLRPDSDSGLVGWSVDELITLDIRWVDGPKHQPVGVIEVLDSNGNKYPPSPIFSRMG